MAGVALPLSPFETALFLLPQTFYFAGSREVGAPEVNFANKNLVLSVSQFFPASLPDSPESPPPPPIIMSPSDLASDNSHRPSIRGSRWVIPARGFSKCFL